MVSVLEGVRLVLDCFYEVFRFGNVFECFEGVYCVFDVFCMCFCVFSIHPPPPPPPPPPQTTITLFLRRAS